jgi:hypothetical protein
MSTGRIEYAVRYKDGDNFSLIEFGPGSDFAANAAAEMRQGTRHPEWISVVSREISDWVVIPGA